MSKFKTRIERLEKKAGTKIKKGMMFSIIRMKKVVSAYRQNPNGSKENLKDLIGLSLEDLEKSLKQYTDLVTHGDQVDDKPTLSEKEQEDVDFLIVNSVVCEKKIIPKPFLEKQKSPKIRKEKKAELEKEKPLSELTDEELDREIEKIQERLNELKGVT